LKDFTGVDTLDIDVDSRATVPSYLRRGAGGDGTLDG